MGYLSSALLYSPCYFVVYTMLMFTEHTVPASSQVWPQL